MNTRIRHIFHIYHPVVIFTYIFAALVFTMLTFHPVYLSISLLAGICYGWYLSGWQRFWRTLLFAALVCLLITLINPLFNAGGATVWFYLRNRAVTRESALYGLASGGMLMAVLVWFSCYRQLVSNEQFLFLFGRIFPSLALMLTMILRLIPVTRYKAAHIRQAQKALAIDQAGRLQQWQNTVKTSSILMSWTMEDSIDTADSMRARGFGQQARTTYQQFQWFWHDRLALAGLLLVIAAHSFFLLRSSFTYFPLITGRLFGGWQAIGYGVYLLLLFFPLLLELKEKIQWH